MNLLNILVEYFGENSLHYSFFELSTAALIWYI